MKSFQSAIVIPCYNEANRLNVGAFDRFMALHPDNTFVFVNDGSTDQTFEVLERLRENHPSCVVLNIKQNGGKAEAVRSGLMYALDHLTASVVGFWDADLATPLAAMFDLLSVMNENASLQFVFGSRVQLLGRDIMRSRRRHYLGRIFATAASLVLGLPVYDTQCGAKLFRVSPQLRQVLAEPFRSKWIFDVELLAHFIYLNGNRPENVRKLIYEFPLNVWEDVGGSKVRPLDFVVAVRDLLRVYMTYRRAPNLSSAPRYSS